MILVKPIHSIVFLQRLGLGVEAVMNYHERQPDWAPYIPFVRGIHLPHSNQINIAACDPVVREASLQTVRDAIDAAQPYGVRRMVVHTSGYESLEGVRTGHYDLMITGLQTLAEHAAESGTTLCIENQVLRDPDLRRIYGDSAAEWLQIHADVRRPNVLLTLDTSHAASSAAVVEDPEKRLQALFAFLARPELIGWVHWSDSRIANGESRYVDMHLVPGTGDLPRAFHQRIKALDCPKLLEQTCTETEVLNALQFIERL